MPLASRRHSRLGIPQVNQNPRPPNQHYGRRNNGVIRGLARQATYRRPPPSAPAAPPASQGQQGQAQTPIGENLFGFSSYTPRPGEPDPRDATYWANLNKLMFNAQGEYRSNLLDQTYSDTDYGQQVEGLNRQHGYQQRDLGESAIRSGLTRSGYLDRTQAEQSTDYLTTLNTTQTNKQREDTARTAARQAILQGYTVDEAALLAEAAASYAQDQAQNASQGNAQMTPGDIKAIQRALHRAANRGRNRNRRNNRNR